MKLKEIAERIDIYLKRFEGNPKINTLITKGINIHKYWLARAGVSGNRIGVYYINYQGPIFLTKANAEKYLAWLDAGNTGRHYLALKDK